MRKTLTLLISVIFALSLIGGNFKGEKRKVYDELQLIMTPQEKAEFKKIKTEEELRKFVEEFWKRRDPDPSDSQNEVKDLYYKRLEETKRLFREPGKKPWLTDRGKVYMILGRPVSWRKEVMQRDTTTNVEVWHYDYLNLAIAFEDKNNMGEYLLISPPPKLIDILEKEKKFFLPRQAPTSLTITADIDRKAGKLYIHIPLMGLSFTKKNGKYYANFNFHFAYGHPQDPQPKEFTQKMSVPLSEKDIKSVNKEITIPVNIAPLKGEYIFIVEIEDLTSGKKVSKTYKVRL